MKALPFPPAGEPEIVGDWQVEEDSASVSPDGAWIAFQSNAAGRREVDVRPLPGPGATTRVTRNGGGDPVFARGGELFFLKGDRIMEASYRVEAGRFVPGGERQVLEAPLVPGAWLRTLDGRRFLVPLRVADPSPPRLQVIMKADMEIARGGAPR